MGDSPQRGNWDSKLEYLLSCIGYAVGLGNVWRFPYLCYKNGGGAFLFPYLIVLAICGLPIFLLETSLGQFSSQGPLRAFNGVPMFKGLGYGMVAISAFIACYYNVILSWVLYYLYRSFISAIYTEALPWKECEDEWSTCYSREKVTQCEDIMKKENQTAQELGFCSNYKQKTNAVENFWESKVLGLLTVPDYQAGFDANATETNSVIALDSFGKLQPHLVITITISWIIVGLSIIKGVKSSGKTMYFTATFPYLILTILLAKGLTLKGASKGIKFFITPVPSKLLDPNVWSDAATQIFYSLSVSWGGLLTLSSYNPFRNNLYRDTFIVVAANSGTSIFAGFAIFSYLGYMSEQLSTDIENIVAQGPGLAFMVWPEAMTLLSDNPVICALFSIIFFSMLYSLGISSMVVTVETICTSILDLFPLLIKKRKLIVACVIAVLFVIGLPFVTQNGLYWFTVTDNYAASYTLVLSACLELIAISYFYGIKRMASDIKMMTSKVMPKFFHYTWKYITPIILAVMLSWSYMGGEPSTVSKYGFKYYLDEKTKKLATFLVSTPIVIIGSLALRELHKNGYSVKDACKSTRHWGPMMDEDRINFAKERIDDVVYEKHTLIDNGEKTSLTKIDVVINGFNTDSK